MTPFGNSGSLGNYGGKKTEQTPSYEKNVTDLTLEHLQDVKTPQRQLLEYLGPSTQGNCTVELLACEQAKEQRGAEMMQLMADRLGANVIGYDDWYAITPRGNQYTAIPGEKELKLTKKGKRWAGTFSWWLWGLLPWTEVPPY